MPHVICLALDLHDRHPARDTPFDGGALILGEIHPRRASEEPEDLFEDSLDGLPSGFLKRLGRGLGQVRVPADPSEFLGDAFGREDEIDRARRDGVPGHLLELGRVVLGEGDSAFGFDGLDPQAAVGSRSRQNHPDRPLAVPLRERDHEVIDAVVPAAADGLPGGEVERFLQDRHDRVRWNHIGMTGFHSHPGFNLLNRNLTHSREELGHQRFVRGI